MVLVVPAAHAQAVLDELNAFEPERVSAGKAGPIKSRCFRVGELKAQSAADAPQVVVTGELGGMSGGAPASPYAYDGPHSRRTC